ncbi:hypothetical protein U1Q18_040680, partial [Sarracenia purpurea var. burkii]
MASQPHSDAGNSGVVAAYRATTMTSSESATVLNNHSVPIRPPSNHCPKSDHHGATVWPTCTDPDS